MLFLIAVDLQLGARNMPGSVPGPAIPPYRSQPGHDSGLSDAQYGFSFKGAEEFAGKMASRDIVSTFTHSSFGNYANCPKIISAGI
jgi:hypothetical protein